MDKALLETLPAEVAAEIARLQGENAQLKAAKVRKQTITLKVSAKGAVSIYGLGKWPVTMYIGQLEKTFLNPEFMKTLRAFVKENANKLVRKEG